MAALESSHSMDQPLPHYVRTALSPCSLQPPLRPRLCVFESSAHSLNTLQKLGEKLGQGSFGSVYRALNWTTGETVAVKQIGLANIPKSDLPDIMVRLSSCPVAEQKLTLFDHMQSEIDLLKNLNRRSSLSLSAHACALTSCTNRSKHRSIPRLQRHHHPSLHRPRVLRERLPTRHRQEVRPLPRIPRRPLCTSSSAGSRLSTRSGSDTSGYQREQYSSKQRRRDQM